MRRVDVDRPVKDVDGLLTALKKTVPVVVTLGSDGKKTYVFLEDGTTEDPTDQVMDWQDKPELILIGSPIPTLADGKEKAVVTVLYGDPFTQKPQPGNFKVLAVSQNKLKLSARKFSLKTGSVKFEVGPTTTPGTDVIRLEEPRNGLLIAQVTVNFVATLSQLDDAKPRASVPMKKQGVWAAFRRILKR